MKETLQFIGLLLGIILFVVTMIGGLVWDDNRKARVQNACNDECWPRAAKLIDQVCHCGAPEGWLRAESTPEGHDR